MRILLLGNYPYLKSQSMDRFAGVLCDQLRATGHQVCLLKPQPVFGRILPSATGLGKWFGYLDRFLLFRPLLKQAAEWAEVIHICDQANAVYVPWLNEKPHVVTCHDMLAILSALGEIIDHTTGPTGKVYQRWILAGIKQARHVACVSEATYNDVCRLIGFEYNKYSLVPNGLNHPYRRMSMAESSHYLNQMHLSDYHPFFLHVGGNYWYKNKEGLFQIFLQLLKFDEFRQHQLVLAGDVLNRRLRHFAQKIGVFSLIKEIGNVSNEQLCALYSSAEGLIFPSHAEGFGWPIIEAQACGCPVFTSDRRPMTEIGGRAAVYFNPLNVNGAAEIIRKKNKNIDVIQTLGYQNAKKYSTKDMISNYVNCYNLAISLS